MSLNFTEGAVRALAEDVEETRTVEFVISSAARDRNRTVLSVDKWRLDNFNRNGVVGYQHNLYGDMCNPPNPDDVIGQGRAWIEGNQLVGSVRFEPADVNPTAEKIFRKVQAGTLRAASVGFLPDFTERGKPAGKYGEGEEKEGGPRETFYYAGQELVEFSVVNIPSNPEALTRGLRDHSARALLWLRRYTGLSLGQIEALTVRDLIDRLERGGQPDGEETESTDDATEEEAEGATVEEALADPLKRRRLQQRMAELGL